MYEPILLIHSWTRWIVLISLIYFFIRCLKGWFKGEAWGSSEAFFMNAFHQAYGFQVLFGLTLWFALSPMVHAFFLNPDLISQKPFSFWAVRHPGEMLFGFLLFEILAYRSKRSVHRFRSYAITFGVILVILVSAIPWPWLDVGRPLFRY